MSSFKSREFKGNKSKLINKSNEENFNCSLDTSVINKLLCEETPKRVNNKRKNIDDSFEIYDSDDFCSPEIKFGLFY